MKRNFEISLLASLILVFCISAGSAFSQPGKTLSPLEERVRLALVTLPYYNVFDNLAFQVEGTTAILSGEVTRPVLKEAAEAAVKRVTDIQDVKNNIEVLPNSPNDDRIRMDAYRAIYSHPDFTQYSIRAYPPIHIIVKDGKLKLIGVVNSESDKNRVNIRVKSVEGVFSVINDLVVKKD